MYIFSMFGDFLAFSVIYLVIFSSFPLFWSLAFAAEPEDLTQKHQIQLTHNRNDAATWHEHDNIKITKWQNTKKQTYFQYFQILTWVTHNVWIRCLLRTWAGAIRFAHPGQLHTELGSGLHLVEARLIHRLSTSFLVGNFRVLDDLDMRMVRA